MLDLNLCIYTTTKNWVEWESDLFLYVKAIWHILFAKYPENISILGFISKLLKFSRCTFFHLFHFKFLAFLLYTLSNITVFLISIHKHISLCIQVSSKNKQHLNDIESRNTQQIRWFNNVCALVLSIETAVRKCFGNCLCQLAKSKGCLLIYSNSKSPMTLI